MIQSNALQSRVKQLGGTSVHDRGTFSYEIDNGSPDLKEQIRELRKLKGSPYWNRSEAAIAGMILLEQVHKEINKYQHKSEEDDR